MRAFRVLIPCLFACLFPLGCTETEALPEPEPTLGVSTQGVLDHAPPLPIDAGRARNVILLIGDGLAQSEITWRGTIT